MEEAELKAHIEFMVKEAERKRFAQEAENAKRIADEKQKNWELATYKEINRCFTRDKERWGQSPWTPKQAIEHFKFQIMEFQSIRFSKAKPLTVEVLPRGKKKKTQIHDVVFCV